jgi:hypothetical protein
MNFLGVYVHVKMRFITIFASCDMVMAGFGNICNERSGSKGYELIAV